LSATFTTKQEKVIQVENQPFELQCIVTGTQAEIDNIINIEWSRPDPDVSGSEIVIAENDPNRNITVRNSETLRCFIVSISFIYMDQCANFAIILIHSLAGKPQQLQRPQ
jgi:hypothetical protein